MLRRGKRVLAASLGLVLTLSACTAVVDGSPRTVADRPNIVFVLTDDLSNNLVQYMPTVQAMAKAGTSFSKYYVTDSLCCPSRSSIFTGEYPHDTGVFLNNGDDGGIGAYEAHGDQKKSFAISLQDSGYRTGMMGKYLNGYKTDMAPAPGWDEWDVVGDGYKEFDYTMRSNDKQVDYGTDPKDYLTDVISGKASDFIDSAASDGKPFFLELATFAPHAPYVPAPRYDRAEPDAQIPHTPAYDAQPTNPPKWLSGLPAIDPQSAQRLNNVYRQRVRADLATDDLLKNVQKALQRNGITGSTYVIFNSDNGYHIGEYRLHAGKQTAFDTDINVPLVVTGPGVAAGRVESRLASNVDLAPTFLSIAGAKIPDTVDGVSLIPLLQNKPPSSWQQAVLVEHHHASNLTGDPDRQDKLSGTPPDYNAIRTADALYVEYGDGEREYYDTTKDPYELNNLGDVAPASLKSALAAMTQCHSASACQAAAQLK